MHVFKAAWNQALVIIQFYDTNKNEVQCGMEKKIANKKYKTTWKVTDWMWNFQHIVSVIIELTLDEKFLVMPNAHVVFAYLTQPKLFLLSKPQNIKFGTQIFLCNN